MLVYMTIKSPDSVSFLKEEAAHAGAAQEVDAILHKYFEDDEYCLLEFNTVTGESRVVPNSEQEED